MFIKISVSVIAKHMSFQTKSLILCLSPILPHQLSFYSMYELSRHLNLWMWHTKGLIYLFTESWILEIFHRQLTPYTRCARNFSFFTQSLNRLLNHASNVELYEDFFFALTLFMAAQKATQDRINDNPQKMYFFSI